MVCDSHVGNFVMFVIFTYVSFSGFGVAGTLMHKVNVCGIVQYSTEQHITAAAPSPLPPDLRRKTWKIIIMIIIISSLTQNIQKKPLNR